MSQLALPRREVGSRVGGHGRSVPTCLEEQDGIAVRLVQIPCGEFVV